MNAKDINGMMLCKNSVSACGDKALLIRNTYYMYSGTGVLWTPWNQS